MGRQHSRQKDRENGMMIHSSGDRLQETCRDMALQCGVAAFLANAPRRVSSKEAPCDSTGH